MRKQQKKINSMDGVKSRILTSAKELFVLQGYKKTTIRQIVMKSGVLTGSIYYFFKNKEDIFQALVLSLFRQCLYLINKNFSDRSPAFKFAASCLVEFKAIEINEFARESYYEGYTSKLIFEKMVDYSAQNTFLLFHDSNVHLSEEEIYVRSLIIKGAMRSYVAQFYFNKKIDQKAFIQLFLEQSLLLLRVPKKDISIAIKEIATQETVIENIAQALIKQAVTL